MKGKIIPLKPRGDVEQQQNAGESLRKPGALLAEPMQEVERLLWRSSARAPAALREQLASIAKKGERICPALFLLIVSSGQAESRQIFRLAASLEALHLALETHRDLAAPGGLSPKEAILCGDFYFGLALTLAGSQPLFIQGMSEVITRFAASTINMPDQPADVRDHKEHLQRICDGSASIFALSCTLGASHGGLKLWQNEALSYYGLYLGIGLQLQKEQQLFERSMKDETSVPKVTFPLIYILEQSPRRKELLGLLNRARLTLHEHAILAKERKRVDPAPYMEKVVRNCFIKCNEFLELVRENIEPEQFNVLKGFMQLDDVYGPQ